MRQGERDFCLGEDMYDAYKAGDVMPQAADIDDGDSAVMKEMKAVINEMTTFDPAKRPSAGTVLTMVMTSQARLLRQVRDDLYPTNNRSIDSLRTNESYTTRQTTCVSRSLNTNNSSARMEYSCRIHRVN